MSYFNEDQLDYMESMAKVPLEKKCWCCWYMFGECPHCPTDVNGADKMAAMCNNCRAYPVPGERRHLDWCQYKESK